MQPFLTLAAPAVVEMRVRGSTFIGAAAPADGDEAARAFLAERERAFWDATHNCSAWKLRGGLRRANDAGEPSGSAGAPILAAIEGAGLTDCVVVVTRYFGGTKLGVGGLVRAYGDAAAEALAAAPRREGTPALRCRLRYPYALTAPAMRALEQFHAADVRHDYDPGGAGVVEFAVPFAAEAALLEGLRESSAGALIPERIGETVLYRNAPG